MLFLVFTATLLNKVANDSVHHCRFGDKFVKESGAFYYSFFHYFYALCFFVMYIPVAFLIEFHGVKKSVTLGMILTAFGLWLAVSSLLTLGSIFIGLGMPFIINTTTKVSASWFGPKGRNVSTALLILAFFLAQTIDEFLD